VQAWALGLWDVEHARAIGRRNGTRVVGCEAMDKDEHDMYK